MSLSTVPGMVVLGCSLVRVVSRFNPAILADLAMRGSAISFLTLACVARSDFVLPLFCSMPHLGIEVEGTQSNFAQLSKT